MKLSTFLGKDNHYSFTTPSLLFHYSFTTLSLLLHYSFTTPSLLVRYYFLTILFGLLYAFKLHTANGQHLFVDFLLEKGGAGD